MVTDDEDECESDPSPRCHLQNETSPGGRPSNAVCHKIQKQHQRDSKKRKMAGSKLRMANL